MKKTLITLMALASCAMGETTAITLENADFVKGGNLGYNSTDGTFSIAITFDVDSLRTILEQGQPIQAWGTMIVEYACNGTRTGICNNGGSNSSKISTSYLYSVWGDTTNRGIMSKDGDTNVNLADLNGNTTGTGWDDVAYAGMVYTFDKGTGTSVALTLLDSQGETIVSTYAVDGALKSGGAGAAALTFGDCVATTYYFDTTLNEANSKAVAALAAVATPVVPEPATATLSLLALAGLAMRRRRK